MKDVIIIGAGAVGCFLARELSRYNLDILVLEKNNDVGNGASSANSAIIHSGYDPKPNSLKAKLNVEGCAMFDELSKELDFHFFKIGSLTLAFNEEENKTLKELQNRGELNGVSTSILSKEETLNLEPNLNDNVYSSLFAPTAGIVDCFNMCAHTMENAIDNGVNLKLDEEVIDITHQNDKILVKTNKDIYESRIVINAAGLASDKIARLFDKDFKLTIEPRKGEYYVLDNDFDLVNHVCFVVPSKLGKGVLVSKTSSNNYIIGPNNVETTSIDDVSTDNESLIDIKNKSSKTLKVSPIYKTIRVFAGNRAHLVNYDDFYIEPSKLNPNFINLVGIESPGLTSSPAIAKYVINEFISKLIKLDLKSNFNPYVKKYIVMKDIKSVEEKDKIIKSNPEYGKIICSCECVSLGEINDVLSRSVPINSIKALKKRLRTGYGRCQGGFCQPLLAGILAKHKDIDLKDILYSEDDSNILKERAK